MSAELVGFAVAILAAVVLYSRFQSRRERASEPQTAADLMAQLAAEAVDAAKEGYGVGLDYTGGSVESVESILAALHEEHRGRPFTRERLVAAANRWGAYVGEAARRSKGGEWQRDSAHAGHNTYPLVLASHHEIYPCAWCFRRITNGPEDNVWVKFQLAVLRDETQAEIIDAHG